MNGQISPAVPAPIPPRLPHWQTALVVLAVLFVASEAVYLALGGTARMCLGELAACGTLPTEISQALFTNYLNESGAKVFYSSFAVGLPGFNNLFYLFVAGVSVDFLGLLLATTAASLIIGFLVVWGYLALSANRGVAMRLLLAIAFGLGWWAFYNYTEASVYGADFLSLVSTRYLEIPMGAAGLFIASFFTRRFS